MKTAARNDCGSIRSGIIPLIDVGAFPGPFDGVGVRVPVGYFLEADGLADKRKADARI